MNYYIIVPCGHYATGRMSIVICNNNAKLTARIILKSISQKLAVKCHDGKFLTTVKLINVICYMHLT